MRDVDDDYSDQDDHAPRTIRATTVGSKVLDILPEDFERFVKDTVRLAIFSSHSEAATVKRDDIKARKGPSFLLQETLGETTCWYFCYCEMCMRGGV